MDQPIACSLSATDLAARKRDIAAIGRDALRSRTPVDGGARLTFAATDTVERQLRAVIAAEAECCSFLDFDLRRDDDALQLVVTGPAEAQPIIEELFV